MIVAKWMLDFKENPHNMNQIKTSPLLGSICYLFPVEEDVQTYHAHFYTYR